MQEKEKKEGNAPLLDDNRCPLPRTQPTKVRQSLFRHDNVQVVFGLVDVSCEGDDARDTGRFFHTTNESVLLESREREKKNVRSVLLGLAEGVCMILNFAFLKKSALPPNPFNILLPSAFVELA
jgi:hypothetical protein